MSRFVADDSGRPGYQEEMVVLSRYAAASTELGAFRAILPRIAVSADLARVLGRPEIVLGHQGNYRQAAIGTTDRCAGGHALIEDAGFCAAAADLLRKAAGVISGESLPTDLLPPTDDEVAELEARLEEQGL